MKFLTNLSFKNSTTVGYRYFPVDLVYLWTNSSGSSVQNENGNCLSSSVLKEKPQDNWELLFFLRSVNQNLPWIRKIFLITDQKIPLWLQLNEKIYIVDPKEIVPAEFLPFQGLGASEFFLDKISDLSEHFLYLRGNIYIIAELDRKYFFASDGTPILTLPRHGKKLTSDFLCSRKSTPAPCISGAHISRENNQSVVPFLKTALSEWRGQNTEKMAELLKGINEREESKCCIPFWLNFLAQQTGLKKGDVIFSKKIKLYPLQNLKLIEKDIKANKPYIVSIIEDEKTTEEDVKAYPFLLLSLFSNPSIFESVTYKPLTLSDSSWRTVFTSFDEKYSRYFFSTLQSLKSNRGKSKWELVILHSDLSDKTKKALSLWEDSNFRIIFYDVFPFLLTLGGQLRLKVRSYWSIATYFKCFIPLITNSLKNVLFIDSDVVINSSPEDLFSDDSKNESIKLLAVLDSASPCLKPLFPERLNQLTKLGVLNPETYYFNAGVLVFKLSNIEKTWYLKELISAFHKDELLFQDQDILNVVFNSHTELKPIQFNYQQGALISNPNYLNYLPNDLRKEWKKAETEAVIIHFTGSKKPWNSLEGHFNFLFWRNLRNCDEYEMVLLECTSQLGRNSTLTILERIKRQPLWPMIDKFTKLLFPLGSERRERVKSFMSKI